MTPPGFGDGNSPCPSVSSSSTAASRTSLVRLDNVAVTLGGSRIFHRLSLNLYAGEHAAVVGRNGAGKSTLLRLLHGDVRPDQTGGEDPGRVFWRFQDREENSVLCAREHVRLVSDSRQRDYARYGWNVTGREIFLSGLDNAVMLYGETTERQARRAARLAGEAGAEELLEKRAGAMSQGELRLCLILRALMSRPCLLLLDEPFEGLDMRARAAVLRAVALAADKGATLLVSAHRREDVPPMTRICLWLRRGRVVQLPLEDAAKALLPEDGETDETAVSDGTAEAGDVPTHETVRVEAGGNSAGSGILEQDVDRAVTPAGQAGGEGAEPDFVRRLRAVVPGEELLRLSHVDVYRERVAVLRDINWTIRAGEQWIVTGSNGAGKSTLLGLLHGEEFVAWGGELSWCGRPRPGLEELRRGLGHVSDRLLNACDEDMSAEDAVIFGLRGNLGLYGEPSARERGLARFWLELFALLAAKDRPMRALSSGMAQRVLLARALAGSPPVLLLDEPCSGLDPHGRTLLLKALPLLAGRGAHCVFVSHHARDAGDLFTHELHLQNGRVAYAGTRR